MTEGRPTWQRVRRAQGRLSTEAVQRMDALQRANQIRTRRAQLKRDLKAGRTSIHDLLLSPPDYLETAKVFDMLLAVPKYGRVDSEKGFIGDGGGFRAHEN